MITKKTQIHNLSNISKLKSPSNIVYFMYCIFLISLFSRLNLQGTIFELLGSIRIYLAIGIYLGLFHKNIPQQIIILSKQKAFIAPFALLLLLIVSSYLNSNQDSFYYWAKVSFTLISLSLWSFMLVKNNQDLEKIIKILITAILLSVLLFLFYSLLISTETLRFKLGLSNDSNDTAYLICCSLPLLASQINKTNNKYKKTLYLLLIVVAIYAVFLTGSRAGVIILIAITMIYYFIKIYYSKKRIWNILLSIFMLPILLSCFYLLFINFKMPSQIERVLSITHIDSITSFEKVDTMTSRIPAQIAAVKIWLDNPLFGNGTGSFVSSSYLYFVDKSLYMGIRSHNTFLDLLAENGLLGLTLFLFWLLTLFKIFSSRYLESFALIVVIAFLACFTTNTVVGWPILFIITGIASSLKMRSIGI